jgi:5'-3' exonuclease
VSGDKDLYQLISPTVTVYHPQSHAVVTNRVFMQEWKGLLPEDWREVKAIAGCKIDDIHGVEGVGEETARKYLTRDPKLQPKKALVISKFQGGKQFWDNRILVTLPYPGTKSVELWVHDPPTAKAWDGLCRRLGMSSLMGRGPG